VTPSANSSAAAEPIIGLLLALLFLLAPVSATPADAAVLAGRVTRVIDGDTLDVVLSSGRIRVRLHGIDAPERDQPGGTESGEWLRQRVQSREVLLEPVSQDRYERIVAIVYLDDANVNRELLRTGHAWAYRSFLRRADRIFCDIEATARGARIGLWGAPTARAPWEHRRTQGRGPFTDYRRQTGADCWRLRKQT
jgi:micrococcal nuclease